MDRGSSYPLVSVITPSLNAAATLERTLKSVAAQTYRNVEHIVIDGGSNDGTTDILKRFRSGIPLRWVTEEDSGMYAAINRGLAMARGTVVAYLNADDLYFPWSIRCAISRLKSSATDLVFGDVLILFKREGRVRNAWIQFYPQFDPRVYAFEVVMGQPSVFWHRRVTDAIGGFDEAMKNSGDFEYWLRAADAGFRYEKVNEVTAVEVHHEHTLTMRHPGRVRDEIELARSRYPAIRPRTLMPLRRYQRLLWWRLTTAWFFLNFWRARQSHWPRAIALLKSAGVQIRARDLLPLLLPLHLPPSWRVWRADPQDIETRLLRDVEVSLSRAHGAGTSS